MLNDLSAVLDASAQLGIRYVLLPLVDNGSLTTDEEEEALLEGLLPLRERLIASNLKIVFESDFGPERLAHFIARFPEDAFGINYDIGNSAALGCAPLRKSPAMVGASTTCMSRIVSWGAP